MASFGSFALALNSNFTRQTRRKLEGTNQEEVFTNHYDSKYYTHTTYYTSNVYRKSQTAQRAIMQALLRLKHTKG